MTLAQYYTKAADELVDEALKLDSFGAHASAENCLKRAKELRAKALTAKSAVVNEATQCAHPHSCDEQGHIKKGIK